MTQQSCRILIVVLLTSGCQEFAGEAGTVSLGGGAGLSTTFGGTVRTSGDAWNTHSFAVSGPARVTVTLSWSKKSADLNLFLRDAAGSGVSRAATADRPERIVYDVQPADALGTWSIGVKAVSQGASYRARVDVEPLPASTGSIAGRFWVDRDDDGRIGPDEVSVGGGTVELHSPAGALFATVTAGAGGSFSFLEVAPGSYDVTVQPPPGFAPRWVAGHRTIVTRQSVDVQPGQTSPFDIGLVAGTHLTGEVDAAGTSWIPHRFDVDAATELAITLDWESDADLNLFLRDPTSTNVAMATGSQTRPESLIHTVSAASLGTWNAAVKARLGATAYHLVVEQRPLTAPTGDVPQDSTVALKAPARGLMTRAGMPAASMPFIDSMVAHVYWKDLEAGDQNFTGTGWSLIDKALASGHRVKVRMYAGIHAPSFVKQIGGPGVSDPAVNLDCSAGGVAVFNPFDGKGGCTARFWNPEVQRQYRQVMTELASRYDSHPQLREIINSGCMTVYAEPFYRAHSDFDSNLRLYAEGLNEESDLACHQNVMRIHDELFARTRTSISINPWEIVDPTAPSGRRTSFRMTYDFIEWARSSLGDKLMLQNNGLGENDGCQDGKTEMTSHFCYLAAYDGAKGFQSETWSRLMVAGNGPTVTAPSSEAGLFMAIDNALAMGGCFVELPGGYTQVVDLERLAAADADLEARCRY